MAHDCTDCRCTPPIRADQTVADAARHDAAAIETLREMGINHCCGAHLTLREAAAAAGIPIEALLAALNDRRRTPA